jgi:hypothetical protein
MSQNVPLADVKMRIALRRRTPIQAAQTLTHPADIKRLRVVLTPIPAQTVEDVEEILRTRVRRRDAVATQDIWTTMSQVNNTGDVMRMRTKMIVEMIVEDLTETDQDSTQATKVRQDLMVTETLVQDTEIWRRAPARNLAIMH